MDTGRATSGSPPAVFSRGAWRALWVVAGLAAVMLAGASLWLGELNQDEGWYLYAARLVSEGWLPYVDFAHTQPPVMPFVYALAQPLVACCGLAGGRLFTAVLGLGAALAAAGLARRAVPPEREAVAALVRRHPLPRAHPFAPGRRFTAVDHVSLSVAPGAALGVVGASGSGKSTLLRLLAGLERPDAGAVTLAGAPFPAADRATLRAQRRRLQIVFQDPGGSLDPVWSAGRSVAEPLGLIDPPPAPAERAARAAAALARVGLPADAAGRRPHAFSGGQRQRIAIARAIVVRPDLLLLDEAVSALDALSRAQVLALVADLRRDLGLALLFVSHDLAVIRAACEQVAVMDAGRIVEAGPTAQVLAHPAHPVTRALVAATPALHPAPETPA